MNPDLKKLINEIKKYPSHLTVVAVTGVLYAIAQSRISMIMKDLTDNMNQGNIEALKSTIVITLALSIITLVTKYFHLYKMNYIAELVGQSLRNQMERKFTRLSLSYHNNYSTGPGGMISLVLADVRAIIDGLRMVADVFLHPLLFILLFINLLVLDWKLTLFAFSIAPFVIIALRNLAKSVRKYAPIGFQQLEGLTSVIKETLDGIRILQSYNLENVISKKFEHMGKEFTDSRRTMHSRGELAGPLAEFSGALILVLAMYYITQNVSTGQATVGTFIAYVTNLLMMSMPLKRAQETFVRIQEVITAANRVFGLIDAPHEVKRNPEHFDFPQNWSRIRLENISLSFGDKPVLKNVSLEVKRGETVAFVGESGSGKSSILNLLLRFYEPSSGQIFIDETPIQDIELGQLRKNIGMVSQDVFLFNDSIKSNIQFGNLERTAQDIETVAKLANAHDFIARMPRSYDSLVGDRGNLLSGGEKQRISIARALFKDAPILILDEATSALDSTNEVEVQKGLDSLIQGRTTFVVAHRLSTIQNVQRIYVIKSGEVVEIGSHQELIQKRSEYFKFYQLQNTSL